MNKRYIRYTVLFLAGLFLVMGLTLFGYLKPAFHRFTVKITEDEAMRVARHLTGELKQDNWPRLTAEDIPPSFSRSVRTALKDFSIHKVRVFDQTGTIIFSTDSDETGSRNTGGYFTNEMTRSKMISRLVKRDDKTLEGEHLTIDVVESYVPIFHEDRFIGAFEIYYDVSERQAALNKIFTLFILGLVPLLIILGGGLAYFSRQTKNLLEARFKLANIALNESESRYSSMFNDNRSMMLLLAPDSGRIIDANPAACTFYGYSREQMLEMTFSSLSADDRKAGEKPFSLFSQDRHRHNLTHRLANGSRRQVECFFSPISHRGKSLIYSIIHDIDERHNLHLQIKRGKDEWEKTFDSIADVITILDSDLKIIRANHATSRLCKVDLAGLIGSHCYQILHHRESPCPDCPAQMTLADHSVHSACIRHDEFGRTFQVTTSPLLREDGSLQGIVHVATDITEQRRLEGQLRQTQKLDAIGTLAGGIAHDFNNILAAIIGFAGLIKVEAKNDKSITANVEQILKAGWRAQSLVKQILSFSRKGDQQRSIVQIHLLAKEALKLMRASIPTTISFEEHIDGNCGWSMVDPTQIHQLIINLCTNAFHAMEEMNNGTLMVAMRPFTLPQNSLPPVSGMSAGEYTLLEVSDTGIGMDNELMERIFDPYFTTKEKDKGTGLGLAIVQGIVNSHNGYISVTSTVGKGSRFQVYLPARSSANPSDIASLPADREGSLQGSGRIMFVDDEEELTIVAKKVLEHYGYQVSGFTSSRAALESFQNNPDACDLMISDMTMPEMSGAELVREILSIRPDFPCIICTGFSANLNEEQAKELGAKAFFLKPIDDRQLATTIKGLIGQKQSS